MKVNFDDKETATYLVAVYIYGRNRLSNSLLLFIFMFYNNIISYCDYPLEKNVIIFIPAL